MPDNKTGTTPQPLAIGLDREAVARESAKRVLSVNFDFLAPDMEPSEQREFEDSITNAVLALSAPAEGWQGIETAPKDSVLLLYGRIGYGANDCYPSGPIRACGYWDEIDSAWAFTDTTWEGPFMEPTHWMPLPAAPVVPAEGWQPIDTAPKDGTQLLLWTERGLRHDSWRVDDGFSENEDPLWLDNSFDDFSMGYTSVPLTPTHWQPLLVGPNGEVE